MCKSIKVISQENIYLGARWHCKLIVSTNTMSLKNVKEKWLSNWFELKFKFLGVVIFGRKCYDNFFSHVKDLSLFLFTNNSKAIKHVYKAIGDWNTRSIKVFFLNMTAEKISTKVTELFILIVFVTKSCKNSKDIICKILVSVSFNIFDTIIL